MFFTRVGLLGERRGAQPTGLHMTDCPPTAPILGRNEQMYFGSSNAPGEAAGLEVLFILPALLTALHGAGTTSLSVDCRGLDGRISNSRTPFSQGVTSAPPPLHPIPTPQSLSRRARL